MLELILKSYLNLLLAIGAGVMGILIIGIYVITKLATAPKVKPVLAKPVSITTKIEPTLQQNVSMRDMEAIAGDDLLATQLDLARAYLESDKKQFAKKILEQVLEQGSATQQMEARQLLSHI